MTTDQRQRQMEGEAEPLADVSLELTDVVDNIKKSTISESPIHHLGLFATEAIVPGEVLGFLDGQVVSWRLQQKYGLSYEWNALSDEILLVRPYRTKYSYINHSREPNLELASEPLRVVALRKIQRGEELTLDYRGESLPLDYLEGHGKSFL